MNCCLGAGCLARVTVAGDSAGGDGKEETSLISGHEPDNEVASVTIVFIGGGKLQQYQTRVFKG